MKSIYRGRAKISGGLLNQVVGSGTVSWNAGTVANGTVTSTTKAVTDAALGDTVVVGVPIDLLGCTFSGYVSAAGTVTVAVANNSGASQTLGTAASNWKIQVQRIA